MRCARVRIMIGGGHDLEASSFEAAAQAASATEKVHGCELVRGVTSHAETSYGTWWTDI